MRVSEALASNAIVVQPPWQTFDDAVSGLVGQLVAAGRLPRQLAPDAVTRIHEREAMASTAMVDIGVSIPHARLDGVTGVVAAIAVSPQAVYHVADGLPISIVALVLSSPSLTGEHLTFLSSLSILLQSSRVRDLVRHAATPEEVLRLIHANEQARG